ncbi:SMR family transporter, partial [Deinococcus sp.]|uniref:SMR family transporter n=1 Tax=Deinococcus sp. TaxID=47478 RepID=UPI002869C621
MRAWFALLCAVALDVTGTMCLKFSSLGTFPLGAVVMAGCVAASYVLLKHSNGFQRPVPGVLALILIVVAFALLGQSLHTVALAT